MISSSYAGQATNAPLALFDFDYVVWWMNALFDVQGRKGCRWKK
jgi:hypothetical protein